MLPPEILSFDLFDTLVVVRGFEPNQAFEKSFDVLTSLIELSPNKLSFEHFQSMYRSKIRFYLNQRQKTGRDFTNDELIFSMLNDAGIDVSLSQAKKVTDAYFETLLPYTVPYPGLKETLEFLAQDYQLILTSNHSWPSHGIATLKKVGILNLFIKTTFSGEIGWAKPFNKIWEKSFENLGVEKYQILHIGDNPYTDIDGAIKFGFLALWFHSRNHYRDSILIEPRQIHSPKLIGKITDLVDLPKFLRKKFRE